MSLLSFQTGFTTILVLMVSFSALLEAGLLRLISPYPELNYIITKTWDNKTTPESAAVHLSLQPVDDSTPYSSYSSSSFGRGLILKLEAPFYNDPVISDAVPIDQPFLGLWNYEIVQAMFLGNEEEYLEIELGPKGHFVLLFLKGPNNLITYKLPITHYSAMSSTVSKSWLGEAFIPGEYFPCNITKFNAFSIHGSEPNGRVHMALYPVPEGTHEVPDSHRLEAFQQIQLGMELNPKCHTLASGGSRPHHQLPNSIPVDQLPQVIDS